MQILVDADACPVVDITVSLCGEYGLPCILLCDTAHVLRKNGAQTITVGQGADSVDFALVNRAKPGDVVVTQDYGLAALCLAKRALPLNQDGMLYTDENIDALLAARHTARKLRMAGGRLRGQAKRTPAQDAAFEQALRTLLQGNTAARP